MSSLDEPEFDQAAQSGDKPSTDRPSSDKPGKTRTWWHPLLVCLLRHFLAGGYVVTGEVLLGKMPLRADVVLVERDDGRVPEEFARQLHVIIRRLNRWSLIEFKGPTDSLGRGDFDYACGCSHLYCQQHETAIHADNFNVIVLAPRITDDFREEIRLRNCRFAEEEPGVHRIEGHLFKAWVIETDVIGDSVLTLFSQVFLSDRHRIMEKLIERGNADVLAFIFQQIEQFKQQGESFMIQHTHTEQMDKVRDEVAVLLEMLPIEQRLAGLSAEEVLSRYSPEEVLSRYSPEEVLSRYSPEDRLAGLSDEQLAQLRRLIEKRANGESDDAPQNS